MVRTKQPLEKGTLKMAESIRYGSGGAPYVGPGGTAVPAPVEEEEKPAEPVITVAVIEDDTPLTDEEVVKKAQGIGK